MTTAPEPNKVIQQLDLALESGMLPLDAVQTAKNLVRRLGSTVRVAVLGLDNAGKSKLMNFMAGQEIIPKGADWPALEICWGPVNRTLITRPDGTVDASENIVGSDITNKNSTGLKVEIPLDILQSISLSKCYHAGGEEDYFDVVLHAVEQADIVLWCSQQFSELEKALWSVVPEELKDHSFFVLTKADELAVAGKLNSVISEIQDAVADEFHSLIPLATLQAIAASDEKANGDDTAYVASGGQALMSAIMHQVEMGRQADEDSALLFLKRHNLDDLVVAPTKPVAKVAAQVGLDELTRTALSLLQKKSTELQDIVTAETEEEASEVLEFCADTANQLADIFIDEISTDGNVLNMQGDLMEATDVILLMQLESDATSAADAVTLLLQVQRDLADSLAA